MASGLAVVPRCAHMSGALLNGKEDLKTTDSGTGCFALPISGVCLGLLGLTARIGLPQLWQQPSPALIATHLVGFPSTGIS